MTDNSFLSKKSFLKNLLKVRIKVSISSTLNAHIFVRKLRFGSFSSYILALAPKFCTKDARVNVDEIDGRTVGANFINIL